MNNLFKKYLLISFILHLVIFFIMAYVIHTNRIAKTFVVFGAHSKKPSHAVMKFGRRNRGTHGFVPFAGRGKKSERRNSNKTGGNKKGQAKKQTSSSKKSTPVPKQSLPSSKKLIEKMHKPTPNVTIEKESRAEKKKRKKELVARKKEAHRKAREVEELRKMEALLAKQEEEARQQEKIRKSQKKQEEKLKKQQEQELKRKEKEQEKEKITPEKPEPIDLPPTEEEGSQSTNNEQESVQENTEDLPEGDNEIMEFNLTDQAPDEELGVFYKHIQQEVSRIWDPPVGVPKGTVCRGMLTIGQDGNVEHFEFVSRSKVLIYDLSILRVAQSFKFDKCLWGKRFIIDFCQ